MKKRTKSRMTKILLLKSVVWQTDKALTQQWLKCESANESREHKKMLLLRKSTKLFRRRWMKLINVSQSCKLNKTRVLMQYLRQSLRQDARKRKQIFQSSAKRSLSNFKSVSIKLLITLMSITRRKTT